jgi:YidC/Oxa1 family membrane protein insertase
MQSKDQMHPDDKRNLILFGILSILLWLSYDHFILDPEIDRMRAAQEVAQKEAVRLQGESGMLDETEAPRAEVIASAPVPRIPFENEHMTGTINPIGARIDDLTLKDYYKTVAREENSHVLSPAGSFHPQYFEHGWVAGDSTVKVPNNMTIWQQRGNTRLTPETPVTLYWDNGAGLVFEQTFSLDTDYGFTVSKRVTNNTQQEVTFYPYGLVMQRGLPEEHEGRWVVHEGPIGYVGDELYDIGFTKMEDEPVFEKSAANGWIGITSKNWLTVLVPPQGEQSTFRSTYRKALPGNPASKDRYQADTLSAPVVVAPGETGNSESRFFAGAKEVGMLNAYEERWGLPHFDLSVDWGWFFFLTRPFFHILHFFYGLTGNFGIAIIMLTVILRIAVFPLANTSFRSFAKMRKIAPQMNDLRDKYNDDKPKLQQELVKLYEREKVNPMAGCLPILVQIPIFFSLFKVLSNTLEMRHAPFFGWIEDLSAPDPTTVFNLFGLIPWTPPDMLMIGAWPCLMLITMILQRKLTPPPADKFQAQVLAAMPWLMTFVLAQFAAGLVIYWTFNNLFAIVQQYIIMRSMGVEVDLIGNILGRNKPEEMEPVEGIHPEAIVAEHHIEEALTGEEHEAEDSKPVSKPKPKKSKKKK